MLNNDQIKLVQIACKKAGIRSPGQDGRYRLLLAQYRQPSKALVTSCKQLNNSQMEDLLAICEANGWRMPGKPEDFYRKKVVETPNSGSFAQLSAIKLLAGDLGWNDFQLEGMVERMTNGKVSDIGFLTSRQAYIIIEALKAMFSRKTGKQYKNLHEVKDDLSPLVSCGNTTGGTFAPTELREATDGDTHQST